VLIKAVSFATCLDIEIPKKFNKYEKLRALARHLELVSGIRS